MRVLDLCCGTGSVGCVFKRHNHVVVSVDIDPKFSPTLCMDVLDLPLEFADAFDFCFAAPPCTEWSRAKSTAPRDFTKASQIARHCVALAQRCPYYCIESPQTGKLKEQDFMKDIPYVDCSYCKYSSFGYKKQTRLWTNLDWQPAVCRKDCPHMITPTRHKYSAQRGPGFPGDRSFKVEELYRIPYKLIEELIQHLPNENPSS